MDVNSLFSVKGKVALVTGGGKGIGRMITAALALNGARVYICGRKVSDLQETANEVNAQVSASSASPSASSERSSSEEGPVIPLKCDLQSYEACKEMCATISAHEPRLHILVHNSGAAWGDTFEEFPDNAWTKLLTLNLHRVFTLTQLLLPLLKAATVQETGGSEWTDPARVIHIGSIDALRVPVVENYAYSASKAGLHHLSRVMAVKLGPIGITSNVVACGPFQTHMMAATLKNFGDKIRNGNPLGRIGSPGDVGATVLWLASKGGSYVNGATISLDGGAHLVAKM